jgi:hypothetical protein
VTGMAILLAPPGLVRRRFLVPSSLQEGEAGWGPSWLPILDGPYMSARGGATWRSGYAAVCKTVYTSSILVVASIHIIKHLAGSYQRPWELPRQDAAFQPSGNGISGQALRSLSLAARG